jgi:hypothetical protein
VAFKGVIEAAKKSIGQNKNEIHRRHIDGHQYVIQKNNFCDKNRKQQLN